MAKIIELLISPTGETTLQTKGFQGGDCLQASRWLDQALGLVAAERKTAEFFQTDTAQTQEIHE
jgi:hypothetical protein